MRAQRGHGRAARRRRRCSTALPQCQREWGGRARRAWLAEDCLRAHAAAAAGRADRRAARRRSTRRCCASAAAPTGASSDPVGFDAGALVRRGRAALARAGRESPTYPGQPFHVRCADIAARCRALARGDGRDARRARVARHREPARAGALAARAVCRDLGAPGRARNPWSGLAGCIYLGGERRRRRRARRATSSPARAARSARLCDCPRWRGVDAAASAPAPARRRSPRARRRARPRRCRSTTRAGGAAVARRDAAAARVAAPADGRALPAVHRRRHADAGRCRRATAHGPNRIVLDGSAGRRRLLGRPHHRPGAAGAGAEDRRLLHRPPGRLPRARPSSRSEDEAQPLGHRLLEGAMVRMAAVAVIDVASGRIEALAGALSPCTRQEYDGPGRAPTCDKRLPYPIRYRPDALLNPAVFHDAMPASAIKPIMAAAFLSDPDVGARWLAAEQAAMQRDAVARARQPARPADALGLGALPRPHVLRRQGVRRTAAGRGTCRRRRSRSAGTPAAPTRAATAASATCCSAARSTPRADAGAAGAAVDAGRLRPAAGRAARRQARRADAPAPPMRARRRRCVRRCAAGADGRRLSDDDWEKCRGGAVVDVVAEGWGQGHARASALGVAGMMATLAAAANGQAEVRQPHLVDARARRRSRGVAALARRRDALAPRQRPQPQRPVARRRGSDPERPVVQPSRGTARPACEQVFDARTCRDIDWIAGKTGTPSFPNDDVSLDELARLCPAASPSDARGAQRRLQPAAAVQVVRRGLPHRPGERRAWTKVDRACSPSATGCATSGHVHGAGDHGPNPAGRDRDADRRPPRRPARRVTP